MNLITTQQKLTLDFNQKSSKTIIAKQYDKGSRRIPIQCTANGRVLSLDPACTAQVKMITPDQRAILNTVPIQEDGSLLLELTESMLFYPGKAKAEIRIYDSQSKLLPDMTYDTKDSRLLSTMQFTIIIEPSVFDDDRIIDADEFNALTDLIEKATADYAAVLSAAQDSADDSQASADASQTSADAAQASAENAADSKTQAAASAQDASDFASAAAQSAAQASASSESASNFADAAAQTAALSEASADLAQSRATEAASFAHGGTATREGEDSDNAQYYYLQSKNISESLSGALRPMGTVTFDSLPALSLATEGDMYNVSDEFTTTSDFKEGEDHVIPAGANIYKTSDGCWDILAGSPVTGVKGSSENAYRRGNVDITKADIGLENVANERQYSASNPQPSVAGSSGSCTGNAATATALTSNAGSATQPVYFSGGKPVACTSYANASVKYATSAGSAVDQTARNAAAAAQSTANSKVTGGKDSSVQFGCIELNHPNPFIDFHYGNSSADYTSRIIEYTPGTLTINGLNLAGDRIVSNTGHLILDSANNSCVTYIGGESLYVTNIAHDGFRAVCASNFSVQSSKHSKENISSMSDAEAQKILDVNIVDFDYKEQFGGTKGQHGVIAEEIIDIIPSCVVVPDGYSEEAFDLEKGIQNKLLSVDYSKLVPYLIRTVQIQQDQINRQQRQIDELKMLCQKTPESAS